MRRGQEEIVGFGALLIVLAVVGVILLGIYIRQPVPTQGVLPEAGSFLDALPQVTSTCAFEGTRFITIHELIVQCVTQPGKSCANGQSICTALNSTLGPLIRTAFPVGSSIQGYRFTLGEAQGVPALTLTEGNCSYYQGDQRFLPGTRYSLALYVCA